MKDVKHAKKKPLPRTRARTRARTRQHTPTHAPKARTQVVLSIHVAVFGGFGPALNGFLGVPGHPAPVLVNVAQVVPRLGVTPVRRLGKHFIHIILG
jgi:hypothetical protein